MDKLAFSVDEFCHAHNLCRATFYNLLKRGEGPKVMKAGGRTLISREAAEKWRRQMESPASEKEVK